MPGRRKISARNKSPDSEERRKRRRKQRQNPRCVTWSALASRLPNLDRVTPGNKKVSPKRGSIFTSAVPRPRSLFGTDAAVMKGGEQTKESDVCNGPPPRLICETPSSQPARSRVRVVRRASTNHSKSARDVEEADSSLFPACPPSVASLRGSRRGGVMTATPTELSRASR